MFRFRTVPAVLLFLSASLLATDLKIRVVDPHGAVVRGARTIAYRGESSTPAGVEATSAEGLAVFRGLNAGEYRVEVLAAGFAPQSAVAVAPQAEALIISLSVAVQAESVVVSATRAPIPSDESGAESNALEGAQLETIHPVAAADALRFLPGVVLGQNGRRGSLSSLFVRGGESRYNKVIVDDVTINDPGGTFDFGVVPTQEFDRLEFVRGAESSLYGSDAMTSVVQFWTRSGSSALPELSFGADGGNYGTAHGYASLSGARGRLDYNLFVDQFNTTGQGINDDYSNSSQGANLGVLITPRVFFRLRTRHSNNRSGVQSFWNFNGQPLIPPDSDQRARQNNFLASAALNIAGPSRLQNRLVGFEYHHRRSNVDTFMDPGRVSPLFGSIDFPFSDFANINRAGLEYQGDYLARSWARTTFGYRFEDENGFVGDLTAPPLSHGLRLNHAVFGQETLIFSRFSLVAGLRFEHNGSFGNKPVPRVAASALVLRGGESFSGTRLRFSYGQGIKEPRLEESFGIGGFGIIPNPNLKPEETRAFEAGVIQSFHGGKYSLSATYFNNLFTNKIDFNFDPVTFVSQCVNINEALAHGAEVEFQARPTTRLAVTASYTYDSTQVLKAPNATNPLLLPGAPLLRRPKHSGTVLVTYLRSRWGANLGVVAVSRRPDSDFEGLQPPVTYSAGYGRVDLGGWYALTHRVTGYANLENAFDRQYEEAAGYPALGVNIRAGLRFRIGGE